MSPSVSTGTVIALIIAALAVIGFGAWLSVYFGKRSAGADGWLSARESLPLAVVAVTNYGSTIGGSVLVANVGIAYSSGWSAVTYTGCTVAGLLVLALIARWLREQGFTTIPDVISKLFGTNRTVTAVASLAALIVPFGGLAVGLVAFAKLFGQLSGLPIDLLIVMIAVASVVFVLPGGLTSVAWADFVFGVLKIVMAFVVAGYAVYLAGGWAEVTRQVPDLTAPSSIGAVGSTQIWLWIAAVVPGQMTKQQFYQRVFATKHVRDARRGLVLTAVTFLLSAVFIMSIGLSVRSMNPHIHPEMATGWLLTQLPPIMLVFFGAFVVATVVSSTGACLQSVVANLTKDVYQTMARGTGGDARVVRISRLLTVLVTAVAGGLAVVFPHALDLYVAAYGYSVAALLAPIFVGYLLRKRYALRPAAALSAMIVGILGCLAAQLAETTVPAVVFGVAASVLTLIVMRGRRLEAHAASQGGAGEKGVERATGRRGD